MKIINQSYNQYVQIQTAYNKEKLQSVWCSEEELKIIADSERRTTGPRIGICHGARNGWEVKRLRQLLEPGDFVVGTDISTTARDNGLIQMDFHDVIPWLIEKCNFVYSNSLDHSYNPEQALSTWKTQLIPSGTVWIEWSPSHGEASTDQCDIFGASLEEYKALMSKVFKSVMEHSVTGTNRILLGGQLV